MITAKPEEISMLEPGSEDYAKKVMYILIFVSLIKKLYRIFNMTLGACDLMQSVTYCTCYVPICYANGMEKASFAQIVLLETR
jgi:hypothetical protein